PARRTDRHDPAGVAAVTTTAGAAAGRQLRGGGGYLAGGHAAGGVALQPRLAGRDPPRPAGDVGLAPVNDRAGTSPRRRPDCLAPRRRDGLCEVLRVRKARLPPDLPAVTGSEHPSFCSAIPGPVRTGTREPDAIAGRRRDPE